MPELDSVTLSESENIFSGGRDLTADVVLAYFQRFEQDS
jgi:hypothetical protein